MTARPPVQALISRHLDGVRAAKHFFFAPSSGLSGLPATVAIPEILERLNSRSFAFAPCLICFFSSPGSPPAPAVCLDVPTPRLRFTDGSPWSPSTTSWIWAVVVTITTSIAGYWYVEKTVGLLRAPLVVHARCFGFPGGAAPACLRFPNRPSALIPFTDSRLASQARKAPNPRRITLPIEPLHFSRNRHCSSPANLSVASEVLVVV